MLFTDNLLFRSEFQPAALSPFSPPEEKFDPWGARIHGLKADIVRSLTAAAGLVKTGGTKVIFSPSIRGPSLERTTWR